jgi:PilS N terminal
MSLTQTIIGLLIAAIVTIAGVKGMNYVDTAKANGEIQELTELRANTAKLASNIGTNFSGYTNTTLIPINFFQPSRVSGTTVYNQWKGTVTAAPDGVSATGANDALSFTYTGVPSNACKEIVQGVFNFAAKIVVGTTTIKSLAVPTLSTANVATACDAGADNVTIAYTFTK